MIQGSQISAPPNTGAVGGPGRARRLRGKGRKSGKEGLTLEKYEEEPLCSLFYFSFPHSVKIFPGRFRSHACAERREAEGKPHIVPSDLPRVDSGWAARGTRQDQPSPLSHNEGLITGPASLKSHGSRPPASVLRSPNILIALLFSLCIYCASLAPLGSFPRLSHFHT